VDLVVVVADSASHGIVAATDEAIVAVSPEEYVGPWSGDQDIIAGSTSK
jgi:hypothetical protein